MKKDNTSINLIKIWLAIFPIILLSVFVCAKTSDKENPATYVIHVSENQTYLASPLELKKNDILILEYADGSTYKIVLAKDCIISEVVR